MSFESTVFKFLLLLVLILINAFFSMSEIALISLNNNRMKHLADKGDKRAVRIVSLISNSSKFLATIQVGVTLSGFLTSAVASQSFSLKLTELLSFLPFSTSVISAISTFSITLILSYFSLVLGELVPKKIAMQNAEAISFKVVGILRAVFLTCKPFIRFLSASTNLVVKILGVNPNAPESSVTEEEIMMMVDAGKERGVIEDKTKHMISNIFDFDNTTVTEVMTHRTDMCAIENTESILDVAEISLKHGYSRIPVFKEDLDNILGIIYVKDLLKYISEDIPKNLELSDVMRPATFIPRSKKCNELFAEMTESKVQIAIIVDDYGGTEGLVTIEDLVESILGNIQDEYDNEDEEFKKESDSSFTVDGLAVIDEVSELIGLEIPEGDYDTIAGMMVEKLGKIPGENEHPSIKIENYTFTVKSVNDKRITKVYIEKINS